MRVHHIDSGDIIIHNTNIYRVIHDSDGVHLDQLRTKHEYERARHPSQYNAHDGGADWNGPGALIHPSLMGGPNIHRRDSATGPTTGPASDRLKLVADGTVGSVRARRRTDHDEGGGHETADQGVPGEDAGG